MIKMDHQECSSKLNLEPLQPDADHIIACYGQQNFMSPVVAVAAAAVCCSYSYATAFAAANNYRQLSRKSVHRMRKREKA
jgi:hypothetical protein